MQALARPGPAPCLLAHECSFGGRRSTAHLAARSALPGARSPRRCLAVAAQNQRRGEAKALAADDSTRPFFEPFIRTFVLGVGAGALMEAGHVALQVLSGNFPGMAAFSPMFGADHVTAVGAWGLLYLLEAAAVMQVLKRFNNDRQAAAADLRSLTTLPKLMAPNLSMAVFKRVFAAGTRMARSRATALAAAGQQPAPRPIRSLAAEQAAEQAMAAATATAEGRAAATTAPERTSTHPAAPPRISAPSRPAGGNSIVPAPKNLRRPVPAPKTPVLPPLAPQEQEVDHEEARIAKRQKELRDRNGYLKNMWYAAALSDKVGTKPVKVELCGKEMVLFRGEDGAVHCVDNACPHRGAPLSEGWVGNVQGHDCIVCPYHGWALDGTGSLQDVPAAENKGEWPKRQLLESYPVQEKGGFIWLFFGSKTMPEDARPPIPYIAELDHPEWKAVYEEMEFDCNHFGVFENAIDMAHIHYLHSDSFGNQGKPEIHDMAGTTGPFSVTVNFRIHNKPVNAFWALFQVPDVYVTAHAFLPSTSVVSFTLGNGLSFITFVNTVPISATKSVNRFALVRNISWDKAGLFNLNAWDGMARRAMIKILSEDKQMVEQLKYNQLPAEYSVRADLPQVLFRNLRQQFVNMGYGMPTEQDVPAFGLNPNKSQTNMPPP